METAAISRSASDASAAHQVLRASYRTSDLDAARSRISDAFASHELHLGRSAELDVRFSLVGTPGVSAARLAYGTDTRIVGPSMEHRYHFNLPVKGVCTAAQNGLRRTFSAGEAGIVFRPGSPFFLQMSADAEQLHLSLPRATLEEHAAKLAGTELRGEIEFDVVFDLATDAGRSFFSTARFLFAEYCREQGLSSIPAATHDIESALMTQVLLTVPSQLTPLLGEGSPRRRRVRDAIAHIEEHAGDEITMADLVAATGVGARALQLGFRDETGVSPMTFLRNVRLERVRSELRYGDDPIADVAARWRLFHAGRFAAQYRERFGVLPSQTRAGED